LIFYYGIAKLALTFSSDKSFRKPRWSFRKDVGALHTNLYRNNQQQDIQVEDQILSGSSLNPDHNNQREHLRMDENLERMKPLIGFYGTHREPLSGVQDKTSSG